MTKYEKASLLLRLALMALRDIPNKFNSWQEVEASFNPYLSPQGTTEIRTHEWTSLKVLVGLSALALCC